MLLGMIALAPMMLGDLSGPASWDARITTSDAQAFVQHVLLTGTYPLLPWAGFAILGAGIADRVIEGRWWHLLLISGGLAVCTGALVVAMQRGAVFAAPIGPAMLEFFPPNSMFLIAAATGVGIPDRNLTSSTDAPPDRDGALFPDDLPASLPRSGMVP